MNMQVDGPDGIRELDVEQLRAKTDVAAAQRAGRWAADGDSVAFAAAGLPWSPYVVFHASDGYAVCLTGQDAMDDAVLVVPPADAIRTGVRLVVASSGRKCTQAKAVTRIELRDTPGRHTVDPNPHRNKQVPGWDPA